MELEEKKVREDRKDSDEEESRPAPIALSMTNTTIKVTLPNVAAFNKLQIKDSLCSEITKRDDGSRIEVKLFRQQKLEVEDDEEGISMGGASSQMDHCIPEIIEQITNPIEHADWV